MSYVKLCLKKVYKNWLTFIPFLCVLIFIIIMYLANYRFTSYRLYDPHELKNIENIKNNVESYQRILENYDESSQTYKQAKRNLEQLEYSENRRLAYEENNWKEYYENDAKLTNSTLQDFKSIQGYNNEDVIKAINLHIEFNQYMMDHNFTNDTYLNSVLGISYMASILNEVFPILMLVLLIYLVTSMYCSTYINGMDKQNLLPLSHLKKQNSRMAAGIIIGVSVTLFITGSTIICGTVGTSLGSFNLPIMKYTIDGMDSYIPFITILPQLLLLLVFGITFVVNFISVISIFVRKYITCMLISLVVIVGFFVIAGDMAPLQSYLHLLPTTYLDSFKVMSGELLSLTNNSNVTFMNGVLVLCISNVVLFLMYRYLPKMISKQ